MRRMMSQMKQGGLLSRLAGKFMPGLGLGGKPPGPEELAAAQSALAGAGLRPAGPRGPSRDDLRKSRKAERQRKKQARRRH